jgi:CBS domain-containing protein
MMQKCRDVMTQNPTVCMPGDLSVRAAQLMQREDVGLIPVVNDEDMKPLVGVVTDRDLALRVVAQNRHPSQTTVEAVMSAEPITCHPDDDISLAMDRMKEFQVRRIPIVDERGSLVGIVAQADVALRTEESEETAEVVAEISKPS